MILQSKPTTNEQTNESFIFHIPGIIAMHVHLCLYRVMEIDYIFTMLYDDLFSYCMDFFSTASADKLEKTKFRIPYTHFV